MVFSLKKKTNNQQTIYCLNCFIFLRLKSIRQVAWKMHFLHFLLPKIIILKALELLELTLLQCEKHPTMIPTNE